MIKYAQFVIYLQFTQYKSHLYGFVGMPLITVIPAKFRVGSATFRLFKSGEHLSPNHLQLVKIRVPHCVTKNGKSQFVFGPEICDNLKQSAQNRF